MRRLIAVTLLLLAGCTLRTPPAIVPKPPGVPDVVVPTSVAPQKPQREGYVPGVGNFGFISGEVWRGAQPTADGFRTLYAMGCKTVIDLQERDESGAIPAGMKYVRLPTSNWQASRVDVAAVLKAIEQSPKPVFIHCHVGRDRTGLAVGAYRLMHGMKLGDVIAELRNFHVNPWFRSNIERRLSAFARQQPKPSESKAQAAAQKAAG
jgi:protein tyrosine phosphatase (PTP) superfamily phosphohydrolase (DUF442 family)